MVISSLFHDNTLYPTGLSVILQERYGASFLYLLSCSHRHDADRYTFPSKGPCHCMVRIVYFSKRDRYDDKIDLQQHNAPAPLGGNFYDSY